MILMVLIVGGVLLFGVFAFVVFGGVLKLESDQNKAEANADALLDAAFDGRPDVTYALTMRSLKYDTVVLGAKSRGYALTHQSTENGGYGTLIFEKAQ